MRRLWILVISCASVFLTGLATASVFPTNVPPGVKAPPIPPALRNNLGAQPGFIEFLGDLSAAEGMHREAELFYMEALKTGPHDDFSLGTLYMKIATARADQEKYAESEQASLESLRYFERAFDYDDPFLGVVLNNLGWVNVQMGRYSRARWFLERAVRLSEESGDYSAIGMASNINLGDLWEKQKNYGRARQFYQRAMIMSEAISGKGNPTSKLIQAWIARMDRLLKVEEHKRIRRAGQPGPSL